VLKGLELEGFDIKTGAVCVYPAMVKHAVAALEGSNSKLRASIVCHRLRTSTRSQRNSAHPRVQPSSPRRPSVAAPTRLPPVLVSHTKCRSSLASHSREPPRAASGASTPSFTHAPLLLSHDKRSPMQCLHPPLTPTLTPLTSPFPHPSRTLSPPLTSPTQPPHPSHSPCCVRRHGLPARPDPARPEAGRDPQRGAGRGEGDRHRHHPVARADG
jgi:hypothetical protein